MKKIRNPKFEIIVILLLGLILTLAVLLRSTHLTYNDLSFAKPRDHHKYIEMALNGTIDFHIAPFCWRVLAPTLAGLLPFDLEVNFMIVTCIGLWGAGVTVYYLSKRVSSSSIFGLNGMLLFFSLGWAVKFAIFDFWLPDGLAFFWVALAFYAIYAENDILFMFSLVLGVFTKELVIFVAPLYYTLKTEKIIDLRLICRTLLLVAPALVCIVGLRFVVPAWNDNQAYLNTLPDTLRIVSGGQSTYNYLASLKAIGTERLQNLSAGFLFRITMGTFGVALTLLPIINLRKNAKLLLRLTPFIILIYAQLLFAVDTQRLLAAAFPAVILLAITGMQGVSERLRISPIWLLPLPALFLILNLFSLNTFPEIEYQLAIFALYLVLLWNVKPSQIC